MLKDKPNDEAWRDIILGHGLITKSEYADRILKLSEKAFSRAPVILRDWSDVANGSVDRLIESLMKS